MILRSPRIDIKPLPLSDLRSLIRSQMAFENDANLKPSGFELPDNYRDELNEMIEQFPDVWGSKKTDYLFYTIWVLVERESKTIIGRFTFNGKPTPQGEVEIFFSIETPYRRKGYATEVMESILSWGGKAKLFRIVLIEAFEDNRAAMASLGKLGFKRVEVEEYEEKSSKYYRVVFSKNSDQTVFDFDS